MSARDQKQESNWEPGEGSAIDLPRACASYRDLVMAQLPQGELDSPLASRGGQGPVEDHRRICDSCKRWAFGAASVVRVLRGQQRSAPDVLEHRVALELEERAAHLSRFFGRLESRRAPVELDQALEHLLRPFRAAADLEEWEQASPIARGLRSLRPQSTPPVLDRLVDEELNPANPADALRYQASRYIGRVSHLSAPDELARRLALTESDSSAVQASADGRLSSDVDARRGLVRPGLDRPRLGLQPLLGGLLAAAILLMMTLSRGAGTSTPDKQQSSWGFELVVHTDASDLDPQAAALLSALAGGYIPGESGMGRGMGSWGVEEAR